VKTTRSLSRSRKRCFRALSAAAVAPSTDEILARIEGENNRRHLELKVYSGLRQYTMQTCIRETGDGRRPDELPPAGRRELHRLDALRLGGNHFFEFIGKELS